ncbi:unnamed protein product, partial [Ilex paraguariensis]
KNKTLHHSLSLSLRRTPLCSLSLANSSLFTFSGELLLLSLSLSLLTFRSVHFLLSLTSRSVRFTSSGTFKDSFTLSLSFSSTSGEAGDLKHGRRSKYRIFHNVLEDGFHEILTKTHLRLGGPSWCSSCCCLF